ncbi:MAG: DUF433 domain-containing protein [Planctomycetota bacterium]|nr:DUF433 domain-containing protein [Planctomycetota bacterium]
MSLAITNQPKSLSIDDHGVVRVAGTRVTLDTIVIAFEQGATPEEIAQQYPTVPLPDVYAAIAFYLHNRSEVDRYLDERQQQADTVRKMIESRSAPSDIRQRLLARRKPQP